MLKSDIIILVLNRYIGMVSVSINKFPCNKLSQTCTTVIYTRQPAYDACSNQLYKKSSLLALIILAEGLRLNCFFIEGQCHYSFCLYVESPKVGLSFG